MHHPTLGVLELDHVTFQMSDTAELRVKVYAATPATAAKLAEALASMPNEPADSDASHDGVTASEEA